MDCLVTDQVIEKYCGPPTVITKTPTGYPSSGSSAKRASSSSSGSVKSVTVKIEPTPIPDFDFKHPPKGGDPARKKNILIVDPDSGQKLVLKVMYPRTISCLLRGWCTRHGLIPHPCQSIIPQDLDIMKQSIPAILNCGLCVYRHSSPRWDSPSAWRAKAKSA
jgi:hypothetical protein